VREEEEAKQKNKEKRNVGGGCESK